MKTPLELFQHEAKLIFQRNAYQDQYFADLSRGISLDVITSQGWHYCLQQKYNPHPVVEKVLETYYPQDLTNLLLQWPHESENDPTRLAYTRTLGQSDKQVVTSVGKYLRRHFPTMEDHVLRDYLALYAPAQYTVLTTTKEFVQAVVEGPYSCMADAGAFNCTQLDAWREDPTQREPNWEDHPYSCYSPSYGWGMVIRKVDGRIDGRALTLTFKDKKLFVRSYKREGKYTGYTASDHALEAWLAAKGYREVSGWPIGARLTSPTHGEDILAPYLDGENQSVDCEGSDLVISYEGEYNCDSTNGYATKRREFDAYCEDCEDGIFLEDDDYYMVGRNEERLVCSCCYGDYRYVKGEYQGDEYYIHKDDADQVDCGKREEGGEQYIWIDTEYPPDWAVLTSAGWEHRDDCWEDVDGDWFHNSIEKVIYEGSYYHKCNSWQCESTGIWYPNTVDNAGEYPRKFHEESLERVSSDAEWGDTKLAYDRFVADL